MKKFKEAVKYKNYISTLGDDLSTNNENFYAHVLVEHILIIIVKNLECIWSWCRWLLNAEYREAQKRK